MFEAMDGRSYFTTQWYYKAKDTISIILIPSLKWFWSSIFSSLMSSSFFFFSRVIQNCHNLIKSKRVFYSKIWDDNPLDCLVKKLTIAKIRLNVWFQVLIYVLWFLYNVIVIKVCFSSWSIKEKVNFQLWLLLWHALFIAIFYIFFREFQPMCKHLILYPVNKL